MKNAALSRSKKKSGAPVGSRYRHRAPTLPLRGNFVSCPTTKAGFIRCVIGRIRPRNHIPQDFNALLNSSDTIIAYFCINCK